MQAGLAAQMREGRREGMKANEGHGHYYNIGGILLVYTTNSRFQLSPVWEASFSALARLARYSTAFYYDLLKNLLE